MHALVTPQPIIDLYEEAQVDADMDDETTLGGNGHYGIDRILEALCVPAGWTLPPRLTLAQREQYLRDRGREQEVEYLGVNGDE